MTDIRFGAVETRDGEKKFAIIMRVVKQFSQWLHIGRGTSYVALGSVRIQCERPVVDNEELLLYQDRHSGHYAARPANEFLDGRFTAIIAPPPLIDQFILGVVTEAEHQKELWGEAHDRSKSSENWFWLVGYLAGKALRAHIVGDKHLAKHHTISAAAALMQWHSAITDDQSGAGVGRDVDLTPIDAG